MLRASIINSISIRTDSLHPDGSEPSIDDGADESLLPALSDGDGDADEFGVDDVLLLLLFFSRRIVSSTSRSSYSTQMEPFSPIRYETSRGSIHIVSSDGKSVWRN